MKRKHKCENCGKSEGPAIYAGDRWCSDNCRKALEEGR